MDDDIWMSELLDEPPIADDGFTAAVMTRVRRRRILRRLLFGGAWGTGVAAAWRLAPAVSLELPAVAVEPWHLLVALVVLGVGGAVWIDSEPLSLTD